MLNQRKSQMPDKLKEWSTPLIWVIGLIFICGMTYNSVGSIDRRVGTNTGNISKNTDSIHSNQLLTVGLKTTIDSTKEDTKALREDFKYLQQYLMDYDFGPKKGAN
jgi:hypothetical protein